MKERKCLVSVGVIDGYVFLPHVTFKTADWGSNPFLVLVVDCGSMWTDGECASVWKRERL
jgi:hypothetical protein